MFVKVFHSCQNWRRHSNKVGKFLLAKLHWSSEAHSIFFSPGILFTSLYFLPCTFIMAQQVDKLKKAEVRQRGKEEERLWRIDTLYRLIDWLIDDTRFIVVFLFFSAGFSCLVFFVCVYRWLLCRRRLILRRCRPRRSMYGLLLSARFRRSRRTHFGPLLIRAFQCKASAASLLISIVISAVLANV